MCEEYNFSPNYCIKYHQRGSLSINALRACVYIYIRQLSSFRAPTLWFIDVTVVTCHIQYTFLSLCRLTKHENTPPFSYDTKMAAGSYWARKALIRRASSTNQMSRGVGDGGSDGIRHQKPGLVDASDSLI